VHGHDGDPDAVVEHQVVVRVDVHLVEGERLARKDGQDRAPRFVAQVTTAARVKDDASHRLGGYGPCATATARILSSTGDSPQATAARSTSCPADTPDRPTGPRTPVRVPRS